MKKIIFLLGFMLFVILGNSQIDSSLVLWLRADNLTEDASLWYDITENEYVACPIVRDSSLQISRMNFNKSLEIIDGNFFTVLLDDLGTTHAEIIVVYECSENFKENGLWNLQVDSNKQVGQSTQQIFNSQNKIRYDTMNCVVPTINYLTQTWDKPSAFSILQLGKIDTLSFRGKMSEVLCFKTPLQDTLLTQWLSYLAVKYGVTLVGTDYIDSRERVIWNCIENQDYSYCIAGLGRDDNFGLNQKQTTLANSGIILGCGSYSETNEGNTYVLSDGDFVLVGIDSSVVDETIGTNRLGEDCEVVSRGIVQVTGNWATHKTFLLLDTAKIQISQAPILCIDRSGQGDFDSLTTEIYVASCVDSMGHYVYDNVYWDIDRNGKDAFCLVLDSSKVKQIKMEEDGNVVKMLQSEVQEKLIIHQDKGVIEYCHLFPNPNRGDFKVEVALAEEQNIILRLYSSDGKLVLEKEEQGHSYYEINGSVQTAGHYLLEITSKGDKKSLKMIVQ